MIARGSITAGGITNGGILAGGILASQTESIYRDHALYLDNTLDRVSGRSLSCLVPGTRYDLVNGVQTAFTENTPVITEKGIRSVGAYQHLCKYSEDFSNAAWLKLDGATISSGGFVDMSANPASRVVQHLGTLNVGTYTFSMLIQAMVGNEGKYPISINVGGTLSNYLIDITPEFQKIKITIDITTSTYIIIYLGNRQVIGGTVFRAYVKNISVNAKKYPHPYITTTSTAVASVSESGTVAAGECTNGVFADEIASNFPLLNSALQSQGTLTLDLTPGYSAADVSGSMNILSFDGVTDHLRYNKTTGAIELFDGTNTASKAITPVANTTYTIQCTWQGSSMQVCVDGSAGTTASFDGSFNPGGDLVLGLNNPELQYINNPKVLKRAQWV